MNQIYKNRVKDRVESYFRDKNLIYGNVVHYPYEKTLGANYYVTKFIGSDKIRLEFNQINKKLIQSL